MVDFTLTDEQEAAAARPARGVPAQAAARALSVPSWCRRPRSANQKRAPVVRDLRAACHAHEHAVDTAVHGYHAAEGGAARVAVAQVGTPDEQAAAVRDSQ